MEEEEEEHEGTEQDRDKEGDQLKSNIKSKKAFSMAINDRTMPPAINRLSRTAQLILLILIALATAEYSIIYKQLGNIKTNFSLIERTYLRSSELLKVTYNVRTMTLLNKGTMTSYNGFATKNELV